MDEVKTTRIEGSASLVAGLGFALFFATSPILYTALHPMHLGQDALFFAIPMMLGVFGASAAMIATEGFRFPSERSCLAICAFNIAGVVVLPMVQAGACPQIVSIVAGLLVGISTVLLAIIWGETLGTGSFAQNMARIGLLCGSAIAVDLLMGYVSGLTYWILYFAMTAAWLGCAFWLAHGVYAISGSDAGDADGAACPHASAPHNGAGECQEQQASVSQNVRKLLSAAFVPLTGLVVAALFSSQRSFGILQPQLVFGLDGELLGGIASSLVILALGVARPSRNLLALLYRVAIPLAAVLFFLLFTFGENSIAYDLRSGLVMTLVPFLALLAICVIATQCGTGEFPPRFVVSFVAAVYACSFLLSFGVYAIVSSLGDTHGFYLGLMNVFLAALLCYAVLVMWYEYGENRLDRSSDGSDGLSAADVHEEPQAESLEGIARSYGLTSRETDVFGYLARGHSPAYIAGVLVVSESTVRTHVKGIYRKLGVSSREDLIELVGPRGR